MAAGPIEGAREWGSLKASDIVEEPMSVVGYTDRLSAAPGEIVEFRVRCLEPTYRASVVRLVHGDTNPAGPGFKDERVATDVDGDYPGRAQPFRHGSYVRVADDGRLALSTFTLQCWLYPTMPDGEVQAVLSRWRDGHGYALAVEDGSLTLRVGCDDRVERFTTGAPLRKDWFFVAASYDAATGTARLLQIPVREWPDDPARAVVERQAEPLRPADARAPFCVAAEWTDEGATAVAVRHLNGKVDRPRVFAAAIAADALERLRNGEDPQTIGGLAGAWDLGADPTSDLVPDAAGGPAGRVVNMPMRAVTGYNWTGRETDFKLAPDEYGAMHFHADDLIDAGWETDFALRVPDGLRSGVYAAHLVCDGGEDYVPFVVRPPRGRANAEIALLLPTLTYLAYGNEHITWSSPGSPPPYEGIEDELQRQDHFAVKHRLLSCYDTHDDGSGVCYSSYLRPIVNMRPKYAMALLKSPHLLNADLHLTDWLEVKGFGFDVFTDHDLDADGLDLLARYRVLLTGSHPEYWSTPMLDALEAYLEDGGRLVYLGANGFYWVTPVDPNRPHLVEIRRGNVGTATWRGAPGEEFNGSTGERGGLWRYRGRAPQRVAGIGYSATGYTRDLPPYLRTEASFDERVSWIFEGVGADEPIGDFGLVLGGAAGFEIDRADPELGTPAHALVVARATGYSDDYQAVSEDILVSDSRQGGTVNPLVRADMVYYECPKGGAVFSTGAISWCGSLSHDGYDNNVSRITENVLRRFASAPRTR